MISDYNTAKNRLLASSDRECRRFFENKGCILELAYCNLLKDDFREAEKYFRSVYEQDLRAKWGLFLINLIQGKVQRYPTYFELRNFLEIDIQILINNYKGDYVEKIVSYADFLFTVNHEAYKFIARVFAANDFIEQAKFFLDRGKEFFHNDPELHYLIASISLKEKNPGMALQAAQTCLEILPGYYPAVKLKKELIGVNGEQ
ncbi:MAG: hypothetical protein LBK53_08335 [Heliobacteriaceae bacterium]|jgi:tetratricopeptide (TPR) repeat protein|nr:hypothetical protein [Heliobacteriaceae bacterium]